MKNWKNDDELLNLAFGELSDRDSQAFEARLLGDASAQKELDLLRTLRSDMVGLRDIPEMQFSKERLRDAKASNNRAQPTRAKPTRKTNARQTLQLQPRPGARLPAHVAPVHKRELEAVAHGRQMVRSASKYGSA